MTYVELKAAILAYSHRADLTDEVAGFVRLAEGKIRRELAAYPQTETLDEADRNSEGNYGFSGRLSEVRSVIGADGPLDQVSVAQIHRFDTAGDPHSFAILDSNELEIRGVPAEDAEFTIEYFGYPAALSADADTNSLLSDHEALYLYSGLFYLYQFTQDVELAQGALDTYTDTLDKLNEQAARKFGGASIAGSYNLYGGCSSY